MKDKFIKEMIDERVDIDFDFSEISDKISYSRYEKPKPAPRLKYWLVGSLSAAAVAALAVTVILPFAMPKYNAAAPAGDKAYENAANVPQQGGAQGGAYAPSYMEEERDDISTGTEAHFSIPDEGQNAGNVDATAPSENAEIGSDAPTDVPVDWSDVRNGKIRINGAIAEYIDKTGCLFELDENVVYMDKDGTDMTLTDFISGEEVFATFDIVDGEITVVKIKRRN